MRALADVSWLLPLCYGGHEHHAAALRWLDGISAGDRVVVCRTAQMGLLRLLSNPAVMGADVCPSDAAWKLNDRIFTDRRFTFEDEPAGLEGELRRLTRGFPYSPKFWQDAYLAAFAVASDLSLITFDQGFRKFQRLRSVVLAME
ncbi:MAG: PIN domain-containing protein [Verrucomicrobiaceae bacterium]|nr:PIN domain-containing protein [Verrucomicrobiaceae bacterium]